MNRSIKLKTYYVNQKLSLDDKYYVYDINNDLYTEICSNSKLLAIIDRLIGNIFTFGKKIYVKSPNSNEVITIKKKFGLFKSEYDLYANQLKIACARLPVMSLKPKISVLIHKDHYLIDGDIMARSFTISKNGIQVAKISKTAFTLKDRYKIDILEEKNELIYLSLLVIIDSAMHN